MKIICTQEEKETICNAFTDAMVCLKPTENQSCVYDSGCYNCIEASIEWEIKDGEQE